MEECWWTATKAAMNMGYELCDWLAMEKRGEIPEGITLDEETQVWRDSELIHWYIEGRPNRKEWERMFNGKHY